MKVLLRIVKIKDSKGNVRFEIQEKHGRKWEVAYTVDAMEVGCYCQDFINSEFPKLVE